MQNKNRLPLAMFCDQCEQTSHGVGCTDNGVCGKDPDVESLQKLLLYGLKGMAAYKAHARRLGKTDAVVEAFIEEALFATMTNVNFDLESLFALTMECGRMNLRTMKLLNDGHVEVLGQPAPISVSEGMQDGPGILVTGHDLVDLKNLLEQSAGTGVKVYTHGEMLPAHMYPGLNKHEHLVGHYGGAWQKQRREFEAFAGPIVATTNCVLIPRPQHHYGDRLYTMRVTGVPGSPRVLNDDFAPVIERALAIGSVTAQGDTVPRQGQSQTSPKTSTIGYHYSAILPMADQLLAALKGGDISHIFVIGGCDGAEPGRNYFSDFAHATPSDSLILTLGCGKYRIRDGEYGTIAGLPRLLDIGQCNDAYGAIEIALTLAKALDCDVNALPLTLVLSWFEQKAVAVLLTLLSLGVKGMYLGPNLPAFLTPAVRARLQRELDIRPTAANARDDLATAISAGA